MKKTISLVEDYSKEQGLWADNNIIFSDTLEFRYVYSCSKYSWTKTSAR